MAKNRILFLLFMSIQSVYGQDIHGRIFDMNRSVLEGVTIRSKRTNRQTVTGEQGLFRLKLENFPDTLIVSNLGYHTKSIVVSDYSDHSIELLRNSQQLEEVVVSTGYQKLKANEVAGAVQTLDRKLLNEQTGVNVLDRINHLSPGVRFDVNVQPSETRKLNFTVRGLSSINGNLDPLIVLDGFIYEGNIGNIDPNNIESISILKDAAASSIWGARAGNGVIVITSKEGRRTSGYSVSIEKSAIVNEKPNLFDIYQLPSAEFIEVEKMLFENGYYDRDLRRFPQNALTPVVDILLKQRDGLLNSTEVEKRLDLLEGIDGRRQYMDYFMERQVVDQYGLNLSGRTDLNRFNLFAGYTYQKNEYATADRKMNFQFTNRLTISPKLAVDFRINYVKNTTRIGKPSYSNLTIRNKRIPYMQLVGKNGEGLVLEDMYRKSYTDSYALQGLYSWDYIPYEDYRHVHNESVLNEYLASVKIDYKLFPFLDISLGYHTQSQTQDVDTRYGLDSRYTRSLINTFANLNSVTGQVEFPVPKGDIVNRSDGKVSSYTLRGQADMNKRWGNINLTGIIGAEMRERKETGGSSSLYGYTNDPLASSAVDYLTVFPNAISFNSSTIPGRETMFERLNRFVSLYTNWAGTYKDKYGLTASVRRDGANVFGAQTNDKWTPFWSSGIFWNINEESFMEDHFFNNLKVRLSYGRSGNVDLRRTPLPIAGVVAQSYTNFVGLRIAQLNDPSLRWERVGTWNAGVDFSALAGRVAGTLDFYQKKGVDLYGMVPYDYTRWGGEAFVTQNVASMRGQGFELMLVTRNLVGKLGWSTTYNLSTNRDKTLQYFSPFDQGISSFLSSSAITPVPGHPLNAVAAYKWGGLDEGGNPQGYLNGELSTDYNAIAIQASVDENNGNIMFMGSSKPQVFGSLINRFAYKKFELAFNISFMGDYMFRRNATSYASLYSNGSAESDFLKRWQNPGDEKRTDVPAMVYPANNLRDNFYRNSTINVLKGDHVRFEYVRFAYTNLLLSKLSLNFYINVSNLGLLWTANDANIDPLFQGAMKRPTSYSFGINLNL